MTLRGQSPLTSFLFVLNWFLTCS